MRHSLTLLILCAVCGPAAGDLRADEPVDAHWMWLEPGVGQEITTGPAWFRREVRGVEPSTGSVRIACDEPFTLWVNGKKLTEGVGGRVYRINLNGLVERGPNVFAVQTENKAGAAGLFVEGEVRGQSGRIWSVDSGSNWKATAVAPKDDAWRGPQFDDSAWTEARDLGPHEKSPWKDLDFSGGASQFETPAGFEVVPVAPTELVGSLVAMTWGTEGRLIVSREKGPILNLVDKDGDGVYDEATEFTKDVTNCQGLCQVHDDLYVVGDGPGGAGIFRLPDHDRDHRADKVETIVLHKGGMAEHGPHNIVYGPDGQLYHIVGNHSWITNQPEPTSPVPTPREGYLLQPKFEDAGGHAVGIPVPGGTIWRFSPDGKQWWMETAGFRNAYDLAFNATGDLFSFDSDMEWDIGLPWYRPVRVNHCISGADFGWRSGAGPLPADYLDNLPGTVDVGRGSPTGIVFYEHTAFPEKYRGNLLACDWSMGRILAVDLKPEGATYKGSWENLVVGNPLNVSDIEVDRDGTVLFCTGGRNTAGGVYRLVYTPGKQPSATAKTVEDVLKLPQPSAAWFRELAANVRKEVGPAWLKGLKNAVSNGTPAERIRAFTLLAQFDPEVLKTALSLASINDDEAVRQFAIWLYGRQPAQEAKAFVASALKDRSPRVQRRACEALIGLRVSPNLDDLVPLVGSTDRWLRWSATNLMGTMSWREWRSKVLSAEPLQARIQGMLALIRLGETVDLRPLLKYGRQPEALDILRLMQLQLIDDSPSIAYRQEARRELASEFATGKDRIDEEMARLLVSLEEPDAPERILRRMARDPSPQAQIHYALCLKYAQKGWTRELKSKYLDWYESTATWDGGNSLPGYLANIVGASLERYGPSERRSYLDHWAEHPFAAQLVIRRSTTAEVSGYAEFVTALCAEYNQTPDKPGLSELITAAIESLGQSASQDSQTLLIFLYDSYPDRRDAITRALAVHPTPATWKYLVRSLQFADPTTLQLTLQALNKLDYRGDEAEGARFVILAGLKLKESGIIAASLLQKWSGEKHEKGKDAVAAIAFYQEWYHATYPDAPRAELPQVDEGKSQHSLAELLAMVEGPEALPGDVARGRAVFHKQNCIKCHRFQNAGDGVGPDLSSLRRRFQKKEILESILFPSQVISDQYKMLTVETVDGLVHNGMPLPTDSPRLMTLLLADSTKITFRRDTIEEAVASKVSVMPEGLLKDLTPQQIADLFAFLETSRTEVAKKE